MDERNCPVYTSPSFELPVYCCLVVLVLGVLLNLGWRAVTRAAEEEVKEKEVPLIVEEAVAFLVQAAVQDIPFRHDEDSYTVLHDSIGGIDLLIGSRLGKNK